MPLEVTISSGEQNSSELESTEEQSFNLLQEVKVSSVSETLAYNSQTVIPATHLQLMMSQTQI
ncbi:MAG: hypothetical protein QMO91_02705 [Candidatus Tisiphia sp.]|nr:hypothetical protein [Candidatus Tisiphia sp.]